MEIIRTIALCIAVVDLAVVSVFLISLVVEWFRDWW